MPQQFNTSMKYGCPYDCGLCPNPMQHSCLTLIEITDNCNFQCPICFANSGPHRPALKLLEMIRKMLDAVVANEGEPDIVQISGGEPTLRPQFFEILDAAHARPIRHLMINTNGIRIASDLAFVERLTAYKKNFEVYLQFDSLESAALKELRGADLLRIRHQALENLNSAGISTTLVTTLKKGVYDGEICRLIQFGLAVGGNNIPLTRFVDPRMLVGEGGNTITYEYDQSFKERLFQLFSTNHSPCDQARCLSDLLCCLPAITAPGNLTCENVFRVLIVQFMELDSLDIRALKKSCIHIAQPDVRLIPFESFNLFYLDDKGSGARAAPGTYRAFDSLTANHGKILLSNNQS